jgi:hypothetical protein
VTRPNHARASKGAACRKQPRPSWVRPFRRARRSLGASVLLIESTLRTISDSRRCAHERPIRVTLDLGEAFGRLAHASSRLGKALCQLARTDECWAREAGPDADSPDLFVDAHQIAIRVAASLERVAADIHALQQSVTEGLESGTLVPEPDAFRPRITVIPRPAPVRAFLRARLPRVRDRITPILRRRRRIPRPSGLRVPRRGIRGRAPPLSPVCPR